MFCWSLFSRQGSNNIWCDFLGIALPNQRKKNAEVHWRDISGMRQQTCIHLCRTEIVLSVVLCTLSRMHLPSRSSSIHQYCCLIYMWIVCLCISLSAVSKDTVVKWYYFSAFITCVYPLNWVLSLKFLSMRKNEILLVGALQLPFSQPFM